jgi:integrase
MSAARQCPPNHQLWGSPTCSSRLCWQSPDRHDFALVAILGLLVLRIFEATSADIADLGEDHGHRVLRVCGKGTKIVLVPLPPAVGRTIDRAIGSRTHGPVYRPPNLKSPTTVEMLPTLGWA